MTAKVKPARKGKTLAALEKAAMRWYNFTRKVCGENAKNIPNVVTQLDERAFAVMRACARHYAASKKRKGTK